MSDSPPIETEVKLSEEHARAVLVLLGRVQIQGSEAPQLTAIAQSIDKQLEAADNGKRTKPSTDGNGNN